MNVLSSFATSLAALLDSLAPLAPRLLGASAGAGVLAIAVYALGRSRFAPPPRWTALLWWLVALRALAGLAGGVPLPLLPAPPAPSAMEATVTPRVAPQTAEQPSDRAGATPARSPLPTTATDPAGDAGASSRVEASSPTSPVQPSTPTLPLATALAGGAVLLWLAGATWALARMCTELMRFRALVRAARDVDGPASELARGLAARLGLRRSPRVAAVPELGGPLACGLRTPTVLLPESVAAAPRDAELELVLAHELLHLRHHDLLWSLVPALAERLFFFHPLVRWAAREHALAIETVRDREVLTQLGQAPERYGRLLVRWGIASRPAAVAAAASSPTFHALRRRLEMLEHRSRRLGAASGLALAGAVLLALPVQPVAAWSGDLRAADTWAAADATAESSAKPGDAAGNPERSNDLPPGSPAPEGTSGLPGGPRAMRGRAVHGVILNSRLAPLPPAPPAPPYPPAAPAPPSPPAPPAVPTFAWSSVSSPPPVPPMPPVAPTSPTPPTPLVAPTPPTPPAPPAPPAPPRPLLRRGGPVDEFILSFDGDTITIGSGWMDQLRSHLRGNGDDSGWFRFKGKGYTLTDRATLARLRELFAAQSRLAEKQSVLADRQARLAGDQARIADEQARLNERELRVEERVRRTGSPEKETLAAIAADRDDLVRRDADLARQQDDLARQQDAMGAEQDAAGAAAEKELESILEQAVENGLAKADG